MFKYKNTRVLGFDLIVSLFFAFIFNFIMYFYSGKLALASTKAKKIEEGQYQDVVGIITFLTQKEKMPMPDLYIIENDQPNAFATGRNPKNASVAVTTGILKVLTRDELEGVLAHELSHIKNRDILVSSIAAMLAAAISFMSRMAFWGGGSRDRNTHPLIVMVAFIAAPIASIIIRMAISRTREFGADKTVLIAWVSVASAPVDVPCALIYFTSSLLIPAFFKARFIQRAAPSPLGAVAVMW